MTTETDQELATRLAAETGRLLMELRDEMFADGRSSWEVMDQGDIVGSNHIARQLAIARPGDAVLDEERRDDEPSDQVRGRPLHDGPRFVR